MSWDRPTYAALPFTHRACTGRGTPPQHVYMHTHVCIHSAAPSLSDLHALPYSLVLAKTAGITYPCVVRKQYDPVTCP